MARGAAAVGLMKRRELERARRDEAGALQAVAALKVIRRPRAACWRPRRKRQRELGDGNGWLGRREELA